MTRLPSGALVLPAILADGTVELTPWDPVTMNALKRPFAPFSYLSPTPVAPPPCCFYVPPEEVRRRAENARWVARQRALYAFTPTAAPEPEPEPVPVPVKGCRRVLARLRAAPALVLRRARDGAARARFLVARAGYHVGRCRREYAQGAGAQLVLLLGAVLGVAALWVAARGGKPPARVADGSCSCYRGLGGDGGESEMLAPKYRVWLLPLSDPSLEEP